MKKTVSNGYHFKFICSLMSPRIEKDKYGLYIMIFIRRKTFQIVAILKSAAINMISWKNEHKNNRH